MKVSWCFVGAFPLGAEGGFSAAVGEGRDTVLVVEDDDDLREATAEILMHAGYRVATAPNGARALDCLRGGLRPAVILLDLMMPVLSGRGFRAGQLADPAFADIPVVVVSAILPAPDLDLPGIAAMVAKPPDIDALLSLLHEICQRV